ncbi:elongation factor G [Opitutus terrae]|uniref:Elongation factor G n=1 Tax=Opitutus terrae (strain DSM 11246 / JCM 15787 / PB90-1) TaxID=452637 RepID=B1ZNF0_OPITP|nr:elongation factor G [Opitutus terrae]ACB73519.1 translation elongation factor G [Opitutus terrae PB90-1]
MSATAAPAITVVTDKAKVSPVNAKERPFPLEWTRNIGIAAHIDAGKTTTTERILFYSGAVHKMGEVHEGTTVTDWMEQERERGITITAAAISCAWNASVGPWKGIKQRINIIDTPGHVDFTAEVERSLRVLDGAVAVFCAVAGVQPQSETVWRQANKYKVPRIAFINKMDRTGADFFRAVKEMREKLKANAHPLFIPIGKEENFQGVVDLVQQVAYLFDETDALGLNPVTSAIPADLMDQAKEYRDKLLEAVSDFDDVIAEKYLGGEEISVAEFMLAIRKATVSLQFTGVVPGSAFKKKGIQRLLDCVVNYLPSPIDVPPMQGQDSDGKTIDVVVDDKAKVAGLAFKLWTDPFVGKIVFYRVYTGILNKGQSLYNPRTRRSERVSRLVLMRAMDREEIDKAYSGDICALVGVKEVITGDTLCDEDVDIRLEPPSFPEPVISMSIEPNSKGDQEKMGTALQRLVAEDPTLKVKTDPDTGQTILAGMGELHLDIIRDRMKREFKVEATAGKPQIAYRETVTKLADGEGKFIRQSGGKGQYGHVVVKIEPNEKGKGVEVINEIVGGVIPKEFIKPSTDGILEGTNNGAVAGYPVVDVKVRIVDGSFHEVDSSELAFKMAGIFAFKDAMKKAHPILLEPIMGVEVTTPEEYQGDLMGDINRRRGTIRGIENKAGACIINAHIPLETLFGYVTDIRSLSKGRASASITPSHFEQVPNSLLQKIVETSTKAPART